MYLRLPAELKQRVEEYARELGISNNAAAVTLIAEGLRSTRRRDDG